MPKTDASHGPVFIEYLKGGGYGLANSKDVNIKRDARAICTGVSRNVLHSTRIHFVEQVERRIWRQIGRHIWNAVYARQFSAQLEAEEEVN